MSGQDCNWVSETSQTQLLSLQPSSSRTLTIAPEINQLQPHELDRYISIEGVKNLSLSEIVLGDKITSSST
ncbi:MAG: hypothetical protein B0A82_20640 [Alkalinema sp. CACIAM 70d]|nr:MAG: hypothetical protein B0A82_20640 [Alkalinema sp. CACIAM 70d]